MAADFANAQKRIDREARTRVDYAIQDFLRELLAVTDSLERALNAAEQSKDIDSFIEGMQFVDKQFHDILAGTCVKKVFDDSMAVYDAVDAEAGALLARGCRKVFSRRATGTVSFFNPLSSERNDCALVEGLSGESGDQATFVDEAGKAPVRVSPTTMPGRKTVSVVGPSRNSAPSSTSA